jgi:hypothetical protein
MKIANKDTQTVISALIKHAKTLAKSRNYGIADAQMPRNAAAREGGKPMSKIPQEQVPGVSHRRVGDIVVTAISDGFVDGGLDVLRNIDQEEARRILLGSGPLARRVLGLRHI